MRYDMPVINIQTASQFMPGGVMTLDMIRIAQDVIRATKSSPFVGSLRSSKPKNGEAAYVWRMVAFQVSPISQHQCMPVTADFDMPARYWDRKADPDCHNKRRDRTKELDQLVDALVNTVNKRQWHGVHRWAHALGV